MPLFGVGGAVEEERRELLLAQDPLFCGIVDLDLVVEKGFLLPLYFAGTGYVGR